MLKRGLKEEGPCEELGREAQRLEIEACVSDAARRIEKELTLKAVEK